MSKLKSHGEGNTKEEFMIEWIVNRNLEVSEAKALADEFEVSLSYAKSLITRIMKFGIYEFEKKKRGE